MAFPQYNVWVLNAAGTRVALVDDFKSLAYSPRVSVPGRFELELHKDSVHQQYLSKNYQLEIVRNGVSVFGGRIGRRSPKYDATGKPTEFMSIAGMSWLAMLAWRVAIPPAGSTHMADNDSIDDVMKYFVRYNAVAGSVVDTDREISGLTVEADAGSHPTTANLRGRYQNLLDLLTSWGQVYGVDFDIVRTVSGYEFKTYYPRRGTDRSEDNGVVAPVIFSVNRGNVKAFEWWEDALDVRNFLYVGGQGEGTERQIVTRTDTNSISDWDRREAFVDARDLKYTSELNLRGDRELSIKGSEAKGLKIAVLPVDNAQWGVDWFLGDKVTVYDPEWGITEDAQVVQIDVTFTREEGETVSPIIGTPLPSLLDRIYGGEVIQGDNASGDTPADGVAPAAPTGMTHASAIQQDSKTGDFFAILQLGWDANTETDLDYYEVNVKLGSETYWQVSITRSASFDWLGLIPGADYVAKVYAVDRMGNRSTAGDFNSGIAITLTSDTTAPAAPANVVATGAFSKVIIEWDENSEIDVAGYEVYVSTSNGFTPGAATLAYRGRATAVSYTGLVSTTYYVRVRCFDRSGNAGPYCDQVSALTAQIGTSHIENLAITNAKIGSLAVDDAKIANLTITDGKIAAGAITTDKLFAGAVTAEKMTVSELSAIAANMGSITSGTITGGIFRTAADVGEVAGPAGVKISSSGFEAFSAGTTRQVYVQSSDGKLYAGAGAVVISSSGIVIADSVEADAKLLFGDIPGIETNTGFINFYAGGSHPVLLLKAYKTAIDGLDNGGTTFRIYGGGLDSTANALKISGRSSGAMINDLLRLNFVGDLFCRGALYPGDQTTHYITGAAGGIGIDVAPAQLLELSGGHISLGREAASTTFTRYIGLGGTAGDMVAGSSGGCQIGFNTSGSGAGQGETITFLTHSPGVSHAVRMTIDNVGNVGIGEAPVTGVTLAIASSIIVGATASAGFHYDRASGDFYLGGENSQAGNFYIKNSAGTILITLSSDGDSTIGGGNLYLHGVASSVTSLAPKDVAGVADGAHLLVRGGYAANDIGGNLYLGPGGGSAYGNTYIGYDGSQGRGYSYFGSRIYPGPATPGAVQTDHYITASTTGIGIDCTPHAYAFMQWHMGTNLNMYINNGAGAYTHLAAINDAFSAYNQFVIDGDPIAFNLNSGGKVGIGRTPTTYALEVNGAIAPGNQTTRYMSDDSTYTTFNGSVKLTNASAGATYTHAYRSARADGDIYLQCVASGDTIYIGNESAAWMTLSSGYAYFYGGIYSMGGNGIASYGAEGGSATIYLAADEGDDNADWWTLSAYASDSTFNIQSYASGAWVSKFSMTTAGQATLAGALRQTASYSWQQPNGSTNYTDDKASAWYSSFTSSNVYISTAISGGNYYCILSTSGIAAYIDYKIIAFGMTTITISADFSNYADGNSRSIRLRTSKDNGANWTDTNGTSVPGTVNLSQTVTWPQGSSGTGGELYVRFEFYSGSASGFLGWSAITFSPTANFFAFVPR